MYDFQELSEALETTSKTAKGLVLTSSMNSVFCAGLEITEMHDPDPERLRQFWRSLQEVQSPRGVNIFLIVGNIFRCGSSCTATSCRPRLPSRATAPRAGVCCPSAATTASCRDPSSPSASTRPCSASWLPSGSRLECVN